MRYPILRGTEESAQEPSARFNRQPPTQPTEFIDFQLNEANYSKQSVVTPTDNPLVFPHEPNPPTSATTTASPGRIFKAPSPSPMFFISKQSTSDARPRSAKIINACSYKAGLEKRGEHNDIDKELNCPKSLCEKHSKKHKEYNKRGSFRGKSRSIKLMVKRGRSENTNFVIKRLRCFLRVRRRRRLT